MKNFTFLFTLILMVGFVSCEQTEQEEAIMPDLDGIYEASIIVKEQVYTNNTLETSTESRNAFLVTITGNTFTQSAKSDLEVSCTGSIGYNGEAVLFTSNGCSGKAIVGSFKHDATENTLFRTIRSQESVYDNNGNCNDGNCNNGNCNTGNAASRDNYTISEKTYELILR